MDLCYRNSCQPITVLQQETVSTSRQQSLMTTQLMMKNQAIISLYLITQLPVRMICSTTLISLVQQMQVGI